MATYRFKVRPEYQGKNLVIEFCGDHRSADYPNIQSIVAAGLGAKPTRHPTLNVQSIGMATDEYISMWHYEKGNYELDDDTWGFFILVPDNNSAIIADIEAVLLASGAFSKLEVDFREYE